MIPKEGDKCNICNYRPISILPVFSKVFEEVAYTQLYDYLENNSILHKQQYGFRAKKSTTRSGHFAFLQYLYRHKDSGNVVFSLLINFRKSFCDRFKIACAKLNAIAKHSTMIFIGEHGFLI